VRGRDFSEREQRLFHFFHAELGPLIGRVLVNVTDPRPDELSPRLRQTLHFLLRGDSEKQVAGRLRVSLSTAHEYITALYRRFRVHSRAELMAYAIKRLHQPAWNRVRGRTQKGRRLATTSVRDGVRGAKPESVGRSLWRGRDKSRGQCILATSRPA
jgi:DNA-binding CsgD family transcriptional regulator